MKYDKVFITSLPSFYKLRLWNEVAKKQKIFVIFTESNSESRNQDFYKGVMNFEYLFVSGGGFSQTWKIWKWLHSNSVQEIVWGGWDRLSSLVNSLFSSKSKNSSIVESAIFESRIVGLRALIKRGFMKRMVKVYVPGKSNAQLVRALGFNGLVVSTGGCGILNYIAQPPFEPRQKIERFIFVGRLIDVKNLELLIRVFNKMPKLSLTIVGFGELDSKLKAMANVNIEFVGAIANECLSEIYQAHDVFILPSKSETWGLVVEEALNNGLPVIVSNRVGCGADLAIPEYGLVFDYQSEDDLQMKILKMLDVDFYNTLRKNISFLDFKSRACVQVNSFVG